MTTVGLEPAMPTIKKLQTYALDPTANAMTNNSIPKSEIRYILHCVIIIILFVTFKM